MGWLKSTFITVPLLKLFKTPLFDNVRRKLKDHLKLEISFSYKMVDVNWQQFKKKITITVLKNVKGCKNWKRCRAGRWYPFNTPFSNLTNSYHSHWWNGSNFRIKKKLWLAHWIGWWLITIYISLGPILVLQIVY